MSRLAVEVTGPGKISPRLSEATGILGPRPLALNRAVVLAVGGVLRQAAV